MFFFKISAKIENGFRFRSFSILAEILKKNLIRNDLNKKCSIEECTFHFGKFASGRAREWPSMAILHGSHGPSQALLEAFFPNWKLEKVKGFLY